MTLAEDVMPNYRAAAWLDDNTIVYAAGGNTLKRISADGGTGVPLRGWRESVTFVASMAPLPGSKAFLLSICPSNCAYDSSVHRVLVRDGSLIPLVQHAAGNWYSPTGHLLYTSRDGGLFAAAFDVGKLANSHRAPCRSSRASILSGSPCRRTAVCCIRRMKRPAPRTNWSGSAVTDGCHRTTRRGAGTSSTRRSLPTVDRSRSAFATGRRTSGSRGVMDGA